MLVIELMETLNITIADTVEITTSEGTPIISDAISSIDLAFDPNAQAIISNVRIAKVKTIEFKREKRGHNNVHVIITTDISEYDFEVLRGAIS